MRRVILISLVSGALLALPSLAAARASCASFAKQDVYDIAGPSCATADGVVRAYDSALMHGKLYQRKSYTLPVQGIDWHLTWTSQNTHGTIPGTHRSYDQIERYRATSGRQLVTFQTYGSD